MFFTHKWRERLTNVRLGLTNTNEDLRATQRDLHRLQRRHEALLDQLNLREVYLPERTELRPVGEGK